MECTWPPQSKSSPFTALALPTSKTQSIAKPHFRYPIRFVHVTDETPDGVFSALPDDILTRIAASFTHPNLKSASLVCRSWRDSLLPLRLAMLLLLWGKIFKHGRAGVSPNLDKALDFFLNRRRKLGSEDQETDRKLHSMDKLQSNQGLQRRREGGEQLIQQPPTKFLFYLASFRGQIAEQSRVREKKGRR